MRGSETWKMRMLRVSIFLLLLITCGCVTPVEDDTTILDDSSAVSLLASAGDLECELFSAVSVYAKQNNQAVAAGDEVIVEFNAELYDERNEFSTSTHRFRAECAGKYLVETKVQIIGQTAGDDFRIIIRMNGRAYAYGFYTPYDHTLTTYYLAKVLELAAGDCVEIYVVDTANSFYVKGGHHSYTYLTIHRLA